jgi:hypothetical protein
MAPKKKRYFFSVLCISSVLAYYSLDLAGGLVWMAAQLPIKAHWDEQNRSGLDADSVHCRRPHSAIHIRCDYKRVNAIKLLVNLHDIVRMAWSLEVSRSSHAQLCCHR